MKNPKIYTHLSVDLDAVSSAWIVKKFFSAFEDAEIIFVPANWDGKEMSEVDIAVDIDAGGKGLKGEKDADGTIHSCFSYLVSEYTEYLDETDRKALKNLIAFIDAQDSTGLAVKFLAPEINPEAKEVLSATGINAVLRSLQSIHPNNDALVYERMSEIFSGMYKSGVARQRAIIEAQKQEILPCGRVAIVTNSKEFATNGILFEQGVRIIIYVDGFNIGIIRNSEEQLRADHADFAKIVEEAGESGEWFAHPAGFLFCRGSRKSPAENPFKVDVRKLAETASRLLSS